MRSLFSAPLRVYLVLLGLVLFGVYCGAELPISLFPNSSKPMIGVSVGYANLTASEFIQSYGGDLEGRLRSVASAQLRVEEVRAHYNRSSVYYEVEFEWGDSDLDALKEVETLVQGYASRFPAEMRNSVNTWVGGSNGFISASFKSPERSLDQIYDLIDRVVMPQIVRIPEAGPPELWNPNAKSIQVEINPERMASLRLLPRDITKAIEDGIVGSSGGSLTTDGRHFGIVMPREVNDLTDLERLPIRASTGAIVHLGDVARIDYAADPAGTRAYKTNGAASVMLWVVPKPGRNIERMSQEVIAVLERSRSRLPSDLTYQIVVNPSEFIRSAVSNVAREVVVGSLLAAAILFLFLGSLQNTAITAIEIPLSMILAMIPMRFFGMNLNLISLAGLALSAGMNVDASVVVTENIFRHFALVNGPLRPRERLELLLRAVREVRFSVIASTVASVVVFLPLAFTSKLTNAVLGDLAKAVVFSHAFSAVIALVLVPTVRLQLLSRSPRGEAKQVHAHGPLERPLVRLEALYARGLRAFVGSRRLQGGAYAGLAAALLVLTLFVLPRLPREIIGKPDTDWVVVHLYETDNTRFNQMESDADEVEAKVVRQFAGRVRYMYTKVYSPGEAVVMARLKDKHGMREAMKELEKRFTDTPEVRYAIESWNPAELPIPDPPALVVSVEGDTPEERAQSADDLRMLLEEHRVFPHIWTEPDVTHSSRIVLRPNADQWAAAGAGKLGALPSDLSDMVRLATQGRVLPVPLPFQGHPVPVTVRYPFAYAKNAEDVAALPVGFQGKLVPLRGLLQVTIEDDAPPTYRENGRDVFLVLGKMDLSAEREESAHSRLARARKLIADWTKEQKLPQEKLGARQIASVRHSATIEDSDRILNDALSQLGVAISLSIFLIFVTLMVQFGDAMSALLVLLAVPLGLIGVLASLYAFGSTLSLNSALGVILLNGIAVANSIILVDFQKRLVEEGMSPIEAAVEAGRKRLRPILITSLSTILAILPVALGLGEGGRILQPLGISVVGGLWVSTGLTLFVVPALQAAYLGYRLRTGRVRFEVEGAETIG